MKFYVAVSSAAESVCFKILVVHFTFGNEGLNASISSISTCFLFFFSMLFLLSAVVALFLGRKHTT